MQHRAGEKRLLGVEGTHGAQARAHEVADNTEAAQKRRGLVSSGTGREQTVSRESPRCVCLKHGGFC